MLGRTMLTLRLHQCFIRFRSLSLGDEGLVHKVMSCAWTLPVAGPTGRLTAKGSRELLDLLAGGGSGVLPRRQGHGI